MSKPEWPETLFPSTQYGSAADFAMDYRRQLFDALASVDAAMFERCVATLENAVRQGKTIFVCGNGGSAGLSNHCVSDFMKCVQSDTGLRPKAISIASNIDLMTAIANDISYDDVFVYQLRTLAEAGDVLMTISSSGDSESVVRAASWAADNGVQTIAFTGFAGGRTRLIADVPMHVSANNYGVVEDCHQSLLHQVAQCIRLRALPSDRLGKARF